jgi:hypothetical protein
MYVSSVGLLFMNMHALSPWAELTNFELLQTSEAEPEERCVGGWSMMHEMLQSCTSASSLFFFFSFSVSVSLSLSLSLYTLHSALCTLIVLSCSLVADRICLQWTVGILRLCSSRDG